MGGGRTLRLGWDSGRAPRLELEGGRVLRLGQIWEVAAWEIAHLGSCQLGKYPCEVATWEKSYGKVPNIYYSRKDGGTLRSMNTDKLLKTLPHLQQQIDALLEFDCTSQVNIVDCRFRLKN